ncbi:MAG: sodium:calcium antiporter [Candidatus Sumerlaeaceae bacterium]
MEARRARFWLILAVLGCCPGIFLRLLGATVPAPLEALVAGISVLAAAFLLSWGSEAAQIDINRSLSLAFVALVAVLPEYAVDMYFTWQAGRHPGSSYSLYAVANMTGANRLLLGVGWSVVCFLAWMKKIRPVLLAPNQRTEVLFLGLATAYAFLIPLKGSLAWYDGVVLFGLYVWYMYVASQKPQEEVEEEGPVELLLHMPTRKRRLITVGLFLIAGVAIYACAEPFCEGLVASGKLLHINEFFLIQWLAPVASETPEFLIALVFASRGRPEVAIAMLLSSKLNQWTLLVGMIPWVYAVAQGALTPPIPLTALQFHELLLTAAQSLLGVVILANLRFTLGEALLLFFLFLGQFVSPMFVGENGKWLFGLPADLIHPVFSAAYLVVAAAMLLHEPGNILRLRWGANLTKTRQGAWEPDASPETIKTEYCTRCKWRLAAMEKKTGERTRKHEL